MSTRFLQSLTLSVVVVVGLGFVVAPQSANSRDVQQLSTCLNLATGANRVLTRGACDVVLEMTQSWDAIAVERPGIQYFPAKTLALAVLLNTGGDTSKFKKKDWVSLARLQALNLSKTSGAVRVKTDKEVRAVVTTCVRNTTGAIRVVDSGECDNRVETQRKWVSIEPLQKPVVDQGAPGVPVIEAIVTVGATTRSVTVQPPDKTGSSPIKSITVIAIPGGRWVTMGGGAGGTATFTGLSPDITYTFVVVAANDSGAGPRIPASLNPPEPEPSTKPDPTPTPVPVPASTPAPSSGAGTGGSATPVTPATAPGAPTIGTVTAGDGQASVRLTAPSSTGGAAITSYTVTSSPDGRSASGSSSPIVVTGLTNGTAYTFTVTATNSVGTGSASAASSGVTPKLSQSITFANPVTQNFGTTPTLSATSDSSLTVAFTSSTSGVCTITSGGLLAFVTVGTCTINADQVGDGSYSAATRVSRSFTVSAVVPGAPTIGTATASSGQTSVAFTAPASTGGASITSYTVTSSSGGFTASGSSSPIVVTGLTNGTAYTFTVTATNSAGTGSASGASGSVTGLGSQSITFADPGTKSFGTTPTLTATSSSSLTVSFTSSTSGVCTITTGGLLAFVTVGTCTISADQVGNGSYSAATTVTRSFTVAAAAPGAPTSVVGTAGVAQASVAFTVPAFTGGALITSYTVTSSSGGFAASGSSSPIVVTGLTIGTAYTFTVTATNSVGTGSASVASSSVTPKATQLITFTNPGEKSFGTTPTLTATSSSALTVSFTSSTSGVCTITSGGVLAFVAAGTCTINADQVGDSSNFAATQVTQSFTVTRTYAVGETGPGGGKVFYVASTSFACGPDLLSLCKYLEANPSSIINIWCASGPMSNTVTSPVFSSAIGGGYSNTQRMVAGCDSGLAYDARATVGNGLTDWYVPNKAEWNAMWAARASLSGYFDSTRAYMASEESSASMIPKINGSNGAWGDYHKTVLHTSIYSRAIRAF